MQEYKGFNGFSLHILAWYFFMFFGIMETKWRPKMWYQSCFLNYRQLPFLGWRNISYRNRYPEHSNKTADFCLID